METIPLGTKIKMLRKRRKLTQAQVAEQLNVNAPTYSKYENNLHKPKEETLKAIAQVFNVNIATFYDEDLFNIALSHNIDELIDWTVPLYEETNVDNNILLLKEILEKFDYSSHLRQTTISKKTSLVITSQNDVVSLNPEEINEFYQDIKRYIDLLIIKHIYNSNKSNQTS